MVAKLYLINPEITKDTQLENNKNKFLFVWFHGEGVLVLIVLLSPLFFYLLKRKEKG
jgi:hypothetical protein